MHTTMTMFAALSGIDQFVVSFQSIVYEALPFVIIGALISGILEELLPQAMFAKMIPKNRYLAIAGSALLGLVFPMCECGIVPVMRRLLGKGLPLGCAVAYMLCAPVINPVVIASTWAAFSGDRSNIDGVTSFQMVALRCGLSFITGFIVGTIVNRMAVKGVNDLIKVPIKVVALETVEEEAAEAKRPWTQRVSNIAQVALHDFIDITCFLILGAMLAAFLQTFELVSRVSFLFENPWTAALTMMAIAVLLCLCSEADAFVAANMLKVPLSGKLGFLVLGPMFDLKLLLMFTRVFKAKLIVTIVILLWVIIFTLSMSTYYIDRYLRELMR
ncbi:MAG TPA: permease [Gemmatales bacterium]|nr:permease [Gemmatales bacterium]